MPRNGLTSCSPPPAPLPSSTEVSPAARGSSIISATLARLGPGAASPLLVVAMTLSLSLPAMPDRRYGTLPQFVLTVPNSRAACARGLRIMFYKRFLACCGGRSKIGGS